MNVIATLASRWRGRILVAFVASVLAGLSGASLVVLINRALSASAEQHVLLGVSFVVIAAFMSACRYVSQALFVRINQSSMAQLRHQISERLCAAPYRELESQGSARPMAILVEDVAAVSEFFVALPRLAMQGTVVVSCLAYLSYLSWQAFFFALGTIVFGAWVHAWAVGKAGHDLEQAKLGEDILYEHFRALFSGSKELRLHRARRHAFLFDVLTSAVERVREQRTRGLSIFVAAGSWGAFLFFVVIGGVIFGLGSVIEVESSVRAGYALMFLYMMHPMEGMIEAIPELQQAQVSLSRIQTVTSGQSDIEPYGDPEPKAFAGVALRAATHRYRRDMGDGEFVLGPIDLELSPGEVVFLIGGNGSGKTSLAKLLVGLYEPEAGQQMLNGELVSGKDREAYRQHFSTVFSDFYLFDRVLGVDARNLDERAHELLVQLELQHKLTVSEGVFSTTALSRGQQKRLALLVAFLEDRPVYVFDEWAADQDPVYRDVFYRRLLPELKARGKAVLVVSHDDHYFDLADRQLVLDSGRLVTSSSPKLPVTSELRA